MKRGAEHIRHSDQSARVARDAYTYMHIPIVAGIVIAAVAGAILVALVTVCVWEWGSFNGGWLERGVPIPQSLRERAERKVADAKLAQTK